MNNALQLAVDQAKGGLLKQKRKLMALRSSLDSMLLDLEQLSNKLDAVVTKSEVYADGFKARIIKMENEHNAAIENLKKTHRIQIEKLQKELPSNQYVEYDDEETEIPRGIKIASTVAIFETLIRCIVGYSNDDLEAMIHSFIFPTVYQRLILTGEDADSGYFLDKMPDAAKLVVSRGKEYLEFFRSECDQHLTEEEPWNDFQEIVVDWLRNDAMPLIYTQAADDWQTDVPLTRAQMLDWINDPAGRAMTMPEVVDALEMYKSYKDDVYTRCGARAFEYEMLHAL